MTLRRTASRSASRVLTGFALLMLALTGTAVPASATSTTVTVANMAFSPASVTVGLGSAVTWQFEDTHTTTSNQGFWDSRDKNAGQSFRVTFLDAGNFGYHCSIHSTMHGSVRVPMRASGTASAGYTAVWSVRASTPPSIRYDVQFRRAGASGWTFLRTGTATRSARFHPQRSGTYLLRARTRKVGHGSSAWSSPISLRTV